MTVFLILFLISLVIIILIIMLLIALVKTFMGLLDKNKENKTSEYSYLNQTAEKGKIVFLGDSITEGFLLNEYFKNNPIINRGVGGNTTEEIIERLDTNVLNLEPTKLFIMIGTNDLGFGTKASEVVENIKKILSIVKEKSPETQVFLISITPLGNLNEIFSGLSKFLIKRLMIGKYRKNENINRINTELEQIAKERSITYIDVSESLKDENGYLKREFTVEGLHLSSRGYQVMTDIIKKYL